MTIFSGLSPGEWPASRLVACAADKSGLRRGQKWPAPRIKVACAADKSGLRRGQKWPAENHICWDGLWHV